ncbi:MAG: T9SS type A sorting domain-containing protein [Ilyomonas sp.]
MKKHLLLAVLVFTALASKATTHIVHAKNFQFTPSTINAFVGDTIQWVWDEGFHTTTSTSTPAGTSSWDAPLTSSAQSYIYKLTAAGKYDYECVYHVPGMVGVINVSNVLPVVLASFDISNSSNQAILNWRTATEEHTAYFSIQRSSDGNKFSEIAQVKAVGNSSVTQRYSYADNTIKNGSKYLYYMLVIVDEDGNRESSEIKMFRNDLSASRLIEQLSPNPVSEGHLMIQFNADKQGKMKVELYDMSGKLIKQTEMSAVEGLNNGHLHLGEIAPGVYTIVFSLDKMKEQKRIVVE